MNISMKPQPVTYRKCVLLILVMLFTNFQFYAQGSENVVILWDVTGSLLPSKSGQKDYSGSNLPTYAQGNGMWMPLKKAVIECIQFREEDPSNTITIIAFNDAVVATKSCRCSIEGKQELVKFVQDFRYRTNKYTNIVEPINQIKKHLHRDKINYMFLFTDGDHDHPRTLHNFIPTLKSWDNFTNGYDAYGFYVLVHPDADKPSIRNAINTQKDFWVVPDAKVRIKTCILPKSIRYNIRDDKGKKVIKIGGMFNNADGKVSITPLLNDKFYNIISPGLPIKGGEIVFEVKQKETAMSPPQDHVIELSTTIEGADAYTFFVPQSINLVIKNLPERSLNITIDNDNLGEAYFYDSFLFVPSKVESVKQKLKIDFSEQAKKENSSVVVKVYLADNKGMNHTSLDSKNLRLLVNGKEVKDGMFELFSNSEDVNLEIFGASTTADGKYYGRIEIVPTNLENSLVNNQSDIYKFRFTFNQKWNPLKVGLYWFLAIIIIGFLLWIFIFRYLFYPRFKSIQKVFNIPGMAPIVVRFRRARMVVISSSAVKKQSIFSRIFKGKIIYYTHQAFVSPIQMKPGRNGNIWVKADSAIYRVMPNPMPRIGQSRMDIINSNINITIN